LTYPSEKYARQLRLLFPTEWKNKKWSKPPTSSYINMFDDSMMKKTFGKNRGAALVYHRSS